MSQKVRQKMTGKEARYILKQNNVNLSWLSELLGIKPQSLQSRLNAATFSPENQLMINKVTGRRIFDIDIDIPDIEADANRIPVLDLRTAAGFEYVTLEDTMTLQNPYRCRLPAMAQQPAHQRRVQRDAANYG